MKNELKKNHIISCKPYPNYHVWIKFEDGLEGIVDLNDLKQLPSFAEAWKSIEQFNQVRIDPKTRTITWGEEGKEVDINPMSLRDEILNNRQS